MSFRSSVKVGMTGLTVAGLLLVLTGARQPEAVSAAPEGMTTALAAAGFHLSSLDASAAAALTESDLKAAIDSAHSQFGSAGAALAVAGTLTVDGYHVGDEKTALAVNQRAVIAVQITGLDLAPMGGQATAERMHHELVVFVDADTGEYLLATTVR
jgi:hypothetical protein